MIGTGDTASRIPILCLEHGVDSLEFSARRWGVTL